MNARFSDPAIAILLAAGAATIATLGLSPDQGWGDDFAGYVLQARSITTGTTGAELNLNTELLGAGDGQVGPYAYPWGFPLTLALLMKAGLGELVELKLVAIASVGVAAGFSYLIARFFLPPGLACISASLIALQPHVIRSTDLLMSDVPYLAASSIAIYAIMSSLRLLIEGRDKLAVWLVAGFLTVFAFSVRSNGAFLGPSCVLPLAVLYISGKDRARCVRAAVAYSAAVALCLVALFEALPDGSLSHAQYLTFTIEAVARKATNTATAAMGFSPFLLAFPHAVASVIAPLLVLVLAFSLIMLGAVLSGRTSLVLVAYALLNLVLQLVFPYNQGARYLYPLLIPAAILGVLGLRFSFSFLGRYFRLAASVPSWVTSSVSLVIVSGLMVHAYAEAIRPKAYSLNGPYSQPAQNVVWFLIRTTTEDSRVAFFKPRAMRLLTGRPSLRIGEPGRVDRADVFVVDKDAQYDRIERSRQLPLAFFEAEEGRRFLRVFENQQFVVFQRQPPDRR
jgi:hypothetical protein